MIVESLSMHSRGATRLNQRAVVEQHVPCSQCARGQLYGDDLGDVTWVGPYKHDMSCFHHDVGAHPDGDPSSDGRLLL